MILEREYAIYKYKYLSLNDSYWLLLLLCPRYDSFPKTRACFSGKILTSCRAKRGVLKGLLRSNARTCFELKYTDW